MALQEEAIFRWPLDDEEINNVYATLSYNFFVNNRPIGRNIQKMNMKQCSSCFPTTLQILHTDIYYNNNFKKKEQ